jgi:two-component system cell cycle response regulator
MSGQQDDPSPTSSTHRRLVRRYPPGQLNPFLVRQRDHRSSPHAHTLHACYSRESALEGKRLHDSLRRQNEELRRASRTDPLTGVHNRRHLEEELAALVSAARRHRTPLGVLVVDIDRFKQVNEQGGHLEGDDVLRSVADRIRSAVRTEDVICRWGGDEFLIILPCTGHEGARSLGERIRHEVTSAVRRPGLRITVSIGYASAFDPDGPALVGAADMALFRAKAAGRNQVRG